MSKARLESLGNGRFRISGVLDAVTVIGLLAESRQRFVGAVSIDIDLSGVSESDSAGLALLIEWLRGARNANQKIQFEHIPQQINALARISEVEDLLSAGDPVTVAPANQAD